MRTFPWRWLFGLLLAVMARGADAPTLRISFAGKVVTVSSADFGKLPAVEVAASDHERSHKFKGVAVRDLLKLVDAPPGEALRRPTLSLVVRVKGADGLVCAFAMAEFVEGFTSRTIILASHQDGAPLPVDIGPWRLIAPGDERFARWVRQVVSLEVFAIEDRAGSDEPADAARRAKAADEHKKFVPAPR